MIAVRPYNHIAAVRIDDDLRALAFPADYQLMRVVRAGFLQPVLNSGILFRFLTILSRGVLL